MDPEQGQPPEHEPVEEHLEDPRIEGSCSTAISRRRSAHGLSLRVACHRRGTAGEGQLVAFGVDHDRVAVAELSGEQALASSSPTALAIRRRRGRAP
jgi:hypothetical protein